MSNGIVLSSAIRSNLLTLQNTAEMQGRVEERLATGKKVNSALDNPTNFFTAAGLNRRASDLGALLDGMSNGIQTLKAADSGMTSITKTVETMRAYVQQARQDKSFKGTSYTLDATAIGTTAAKTLAFSGGGVTGTQTVALNTTAAAATPATLTGSQAIPATFAGGSFTIQAPNLNGGAAITVTIPNDKTPANVVTAINTALAAATGSAGGITASQTGSVLTLTGATGNEITVGGTASVLTAFGFTANQASTNGALAVTGAVQTVDELVASINGNAALNTAVRASNDGGRLRLENLSTEGLSVAGASATAVNGGTGASNTTLVGGNDVRKNLITQFNELRRQLDKVAGDSSYNGVNLLRGDKLKVVFNEIGTSVLDIQAKNTAGAVRSISTDSASLAIGEATAAEFSSDAALDIRLQGLSDALTVVQTQASSFGANLATVQIRQEFTNSMINTLTSGADTLVLADNNEEGANLLALNTRQQLSQTALSLASQASQAVLRLFG